MSPSINYFPLPNNGNYYNPYWNNSTNCCETNEQYYQEQYYKQQFYEPNYHTYQEQLHNYNKLNNNFCAYQGIQDQYDEENSYMHHVHHPQGVCLLNHSKCRLKYFELKYVRILT
jgi:hypothetical protein